MNYGKSAGRDYGVKIFGNYQWETMSDGEVAQGHNSAIVTHDNHYLLVNHTRFANGGEGHAVRVHEMFQTQDGWMVAAPFEYSGETATQTQIATTQMYSASDVAGDYQLMIHKFRQDTDSKELAKPENISLNADGTITGAYTGTWALVSGTSYIDIKLNKVLGSAISATFHGVLTEQTMDGYNIKTLCFTACGTQKSETTQASNGSALTTSGLCIWGSKANYKAAIKFTNDKMSSIVTIPSSTSKALTLPTTGKLGTNITWISSDESILTSAGKIGQSGTVTLTARITKDGYCYDKNYTINVTGSSSGGSVTPTPSTGVTTYYPVSQQKTTTAGWWENFSEQTYTVAMGSEVAFSFYNYSNEAENWKNWVLYGCDSLNGTIISNEYFGLRCDNWDNTTNSNSGITSNFNWDTFKAEMNGSKVDITVTYQTSGVVNIAVKIAAASGTNYTMSYSKQIASRPAQLTLFFVSEGSYIDGSVLDNITSINMTPSATEGSAYDISGKMVDPAHKGVIIRNGRKYVVK